MQHTHATWRDTKQQLLFAGLDQHDSLALADAGAGQNFQGDAGNATDAIKTAQQKDDGEQAQNHQEQRTQHLHDVGGSEQLGD